MNDNWLHETISRGFQRLIALGVGNAPRNKDDIRLLIAMWVDVLTDEIGNPQKDIDQERIVAGFRVLFRTCKFFPVPAHIIEAMPPRERIAPPELEYLNFPRTKDEIADGKQRIAEILKLISDGTTAIH